MRLFIAINIPERSKQFLNKKVKLIKEEIKQDLKWVKPANWHLTLKFLGDVADKRVNLIKNILTKTLGTSTQFNIQFRGIGAFPVLDYPRVIFINITKGSKKLTEIHNKLETNLTNKGFSPENNEYTPHLTIIRSRKKTNLKQIARKLQKFEKKKYFINVHMKAEKISLIKSKLLPTGPKYEEITGVCLK